MKSIWLYRTAAVVFVLFALGHTFGFLSFRPRTAEGLAVYNAMNSVRLVTNADYTYGKFYTGFGLFVTAYMLFSAFLAWQLGGLARKLPESAGALGWGLFTVQLACLALSGIYFGGPQVAFSSVTVVCLGWAAWSVQGAKAAIRVKGA